ncbi:MAG: hypothetical protein FWC50_12625, partial [Planctomycetaceae bacterium]|nr:hypothetical protein [Planctomycetaceae bacterium]
IRQAGRMIDEADLILHVLDASAGFPEAFDFMHRSKTLDVFNKCDLIAGSENSLLNATSEAPCCFVSALAGEGIPELLRQIKTRLVPEDLTCFQAVVFTERQFALLKQFRRFFHGLARLEY